MNLPELEELDISDNLFLDFPANVLLSIPKLKNLNIANNRNIGTLNDFIQLPFLEFLDLTLTKINFQPTDLIKLRFALPNTTLVFALNNEKNIVVSEKIEQDKLEQLKKLKEESDEGNFNSSVKLGKYFIDRGDKALGDLILTRLITNFPEKDFEITYAIAAYLEEKNMPVLSGLLFKRIIDSFPDLNFKTCVSVTKKMQKNHSEQACKLFLRIKSHDSLGIYLENEMFRIEYISMLYNCKHLSESENLFEKVVNETGLENEKEIHDLAKYFEENNCHELAIKLYEKIIESPAIENEEKKLFASLSIADIYHDKKDNRAGFSFVHYEGLCYKEYSNEQSKAIILQGCNKAYDSYQDQISIFLAEHKQQLVQMKKKVQRAATARNIGTTVNALGSFASMIPGAGNIAPVLDVSSRITTDVTNAVATSQMASYDNLSSDAFSIEEKIAFLESKKEMVGRRINELQAGNTEVASVAMSPQGKEKLPAKLPDPVKTIQSSGDAADLYFLSLSSLSILNGDYGKAFEHLHKAFKSNQIPIETKIEPFFQYYSYELYSQKSIKNSAILAEALLATHPAHPQIVSLYSNLQIANNKFETAIFQLEKVRQADPNNYQIIVKLLFLCDKAEEWQKLNEVSHEAVGEYSQIFLPYYYYGISLFHLERYNEAISALEKCLTLIKTETEVKPYTLAILGRCYSETGLYEKSESCFLQATSLAPDDIRIKTEFCYGLLAQPDRIKDAENLAKELITSENNNLEIFDLYALTLFNKGNYNEAKIWAIKAIDNHNCTKGLPYEHYGDILYKLGNTSQAVVYWNLAKSKGKNVSKNIDKKIEGKAYVK